MASYYQHLSIYQPPSTRDLHTAVIYLHGGGLLYGERNDLPRNIIHWFLMEGYTLFCLDYLLGPESSLAEIREDLKEEISWLIIDIFPKYQVEKCFLYGRSAGTYLCFLMAKEMRKELHPEGILAFYGYYNLLESFLWKPSDYYNTLPMVDEQVVEKAIKKQQIKKGPKHLRFSIYVYARQKGNWMDLLGVDKKTALEFSLTDEDLNLLPPIFIAASTTDQDVPYRVSKELFRRIPGAQMKTVYEKEHDFDRDATLPEVQAVYQKAFLWMKKRDWHTNLPI